MDLYLKHKTAVVTGASQGIGREIVKQLALEGVRVFATARNESRLEILRQDVVATGGVEPLIFVQDLLAPDAAKNVSTAALQALRNIDILINNAGQSQPVDITGDEDPWLQSMTLDFERPRQLTQQLLPHFIERKQGSILNLASTYELRSINVSAVAKAALVAWSKQLASQVGKYKINVNCLQPGLIDTENIRPYFQGDARQEFSEAEIPMGDFGEPKDIASMAAFLVSPRAAYITGTVAVVDGGLRRYAF